MSSWQRPSKSQKRTILRDHRHGIYRHNSVNILENIISIPHIILMSQIDLEIRMKIGKSEMRVNCERSLSLLSK